jgi:hypothetical protein
MRIVSWGHAAFAVTIVSLGVLCVADSAVVAVWQPIPALVPAHAFLLYLCALVCLLAGAGLLFARSASLSSRVLAAWLMAWLLILRLPTVIVSPGVDSWWASAEVAVMTAAAWVLALWFAGEPAAADLAFASGKRGMRLARSLFGLALIPFGLAHFIYPGATAPLVPAWLPWHTAWAYLTGVAFIAAGVAAITGVLGRLASLLVTAQIGGFTLLVWLPVVIRGHANAGQWHEFVTSYALTAGAWMVADSYRRPETGVSAHASNR